MAEPLFTALDLAAEDSVTLLTEDLTIEDLLATDLGAGSTVGLDIMVITAIIRIYMTAILITSTTRASISDRRLLSRLLDAGIDGRANR